MEQERKLMTEFLEQHFEEMENEIKGKCAKRTREARGERLSAEWLARQKPVPVYLAGRRRTRGHAR